jgi:hypothetical protein
MDAPIECYCGELGDVDCPCDYCLAWIDDAEGPLERPCGRCGGRGYVITCIDDLCRNSDECIHGDGEELCNCEVM